MKQISIRINKDSIHDTLFFFLLALSFYFTRNTICNVMMVLFFGYTVYRQVLKRQMAWPFYITGMALFILWGAINIYRGAVISATVSRTMVISITLNLMMIYAIVQYINMRQDINKILKLTELAFLATAIVTFLKSLGSIFEGRLGRYTEMNSNILSMLCVYGLVLCWYLHKNKLMRTGAFAVRCIFYLTATFLTGSRKGLIVLVICIVAINLFVNIKKISKNVFIGLILFAIVYILIMTVEPFYNILGTRVEDLMDLVLEGTTDDDSLLDRQELIDIGMRYIRKKPWVGYGYDCFKLVSAESGSNMASNGEFGYYAHNNYIELLFSGGIIGFVLYYIPVLWLLISLFRKRKLNKCLPYLLAIVIAKLAIEYSYVSYYVRTDAYIMAVILGCFYVCAKKRKEIRESEELENE
ncbi:MAG: O-antigen ligase family protein [Clostridia bacterium]|nr:O-antigen ligase family protein [Clostridia bacterium]